MDESVANIYRAILFGRTRWHSAGAVPAAPAAGGVRGKHDPSLSRVELQDVTRWALAQYPDDLVVGLPLAPPYPFRDIDRLSGMRVGFVP